MPKKQPSDFMPDKDDLDGEWVRQPELYHEYATQLADARLDLEEKRNALDVIQAELDNDIRTDPDAYGFTKVTDAVVKATLPAQPEYKKATDRVNKARHRVHILEAAVASLDHKKKALENLVYLHGQNYFSSPRARGEDKQEVESATRSAKHARGGQLNRRDLREDD